METVKTVMVIGLVAMSVVEAIWFLWDILFRDGHVAEKELELKRRRSKA